MPKREGVATVPFEVIDKALRILGEIRGEIDHLGHDQSEKAADKWLKTPPLPYKRLGDLVQELRTFLPADYYSMSDEEAKRFLGTKKGWEAKRNQSR